MDDAWRRIADRVWHGGGIKGSHVIDTTLRDALARLIRDRYESECSMYEHEKEFGKVTDL